MLRNRGFRWALLASFTLHVVAFLTIPMGGRIGEARRLVVDSVAKTAVEFVRIVKPPPPPPPKPVIRRPRPRRRYVRRRVRRRRAARKPTQVAEVTTPEEQAPEPPSKPELQLPEPAPDPEPVAPRPEPPPPPVEVKSTPVLEVLPPAPAAAVAQNPTQESVNSAEPVVIRPTRVEIGGPAAPAAPPSAEPAAPPAPAATGDPMLAKTQPDMLPLGPAPAATPSNAEGAWSRPEGPAAQPVNLPELPGVPPTVAAPTHVGAPGGVIMSGSPGPARQTPPTTREVLVAKAAPTMGAGGSPAASGTPGGPQQAPAGLPGLLPGGVVAPVSVALSGPPTTGGPGISTSGKPGTRSGRTGLAGAPIDAPGSRRGSGGQGAIVAKVSPAGPRGGGGPGVSAAGRPSGRGSPGGGTGGGQPVRVASRSSGPSRAPGGAGGGGPRGTIFLTAEQGPGGGRTVRIAKSSPWSAGPGEGPGPGSVPGRGIAGPGGGERGPGGGPGGRPVQLASTGWGSRATGGRVSSGGPGGPPGGPGGSVGEAPGQRAGAGLSDVGKATPRLGGRAGEGPGIFGAPEAVGLAAIAGPGTPGGTGGATGQPYPVASDGSQLPWTVPGMLSTLPGLTPGFGGFGLPGDSPGSGPGLPGGLPGTMPGMAGLLGLTSDKAVPGWALPGPGQGAGVPGTGTPVVRVPAGAMGTGAPLGIDTQRPSGGPGGLLSGLLGLTGTRGPGQSAMPGLAGATAALPGKGVPSLMAGFTVGATGLPSAAQGGPTGQTDLGSAPGSPLAFALAGPRFGAGRGLPRLPGQGTSLSAARPGAPSMGDMLDGAAGFVPKSAPDGLYVGVSGSFDMPMGVTSGDYETDVEGMRNLLAQVRQRTNVHVTVRERFVPLTVENLKDTPIIHIRGHRPFQFTAQEREALRKYVQGGGTIFGEDSHGPFGECFRREMKRIFGKAPSNLPADHELYRSYYVLNEVPAGDMGERYPLQGIHVNQRLGVIYSRNDYGDCWEGTGGWVKPEAREPAFKMGTNIYIYVVAHASGVKRATAPESGP